MPTREDLERLAMTELAVLCGKVAESPSASSVEADQARDSCLRNPAPAYATRAKRL